jgi:transposase, IS5 family
VSLAITERHGLIVGARAFPGNPYDGHVLAEQLEQTSILLQEVQGEPCVKTVLTDLGYRGVDGDIAPVQLVHRGKSKTLSNQQRRWLKRWQAIEPIIGHVKHDHGMRRCWLKGETGDAAHAVPCAAGYNLRWLLRAIARLGLKAFYALAALLVADQFTTAQSHAPRRSFMLWAEAWPQTNFGGAQ